MRSLRRWSLAAKLAMVGMPLVVLAMAAIVVTLWVSFQLDGGAAALNEAGRMRMQAYRLSLSVAQGRQSDVQVQVQMFDRSLDLLISSGRHDGRVHPHPDVRLELISFAELTVRCSPSAHRNTEVDRRIDLRLPPHERARSRHRHVRMVGKPDRSDHSFWNTHGMLANARWKMC